MLFPFFRVQLQRERPTISATMHRTANRAAFDIGDEARASTTSDASQAAAPVMVVKIPREPQ